MINQSILTATFKDPVYIAGPMTGLPEFNYPAFRAVEARLSDLDIRHFSPVLHDPPDDYTDDKPYDYYLRIAIGQLLKCNSILLLPDWHTSKGASLEHDIAVGLNLTIMLWLGNDEVTVVRP